MRFVVALKKLRIQTDYRYGLTVCYQISIDPGKRGILNYKEFLIMSIFFYTNKPLLHNYSKLFKNVTLCCARFSV